MLHDCRQPVYSPPQVAVTAGEVDVLRFGKVTQHMKDMESRDLLEIIEARYKKASTIFCSQFDVPGWREKLGDPIIADAICDRIVHDSYSIVIDCKDSMRKRKGISEN